MTIYFEELNESSFEIVRNHFKDHNISKTYNADIFYIDSSIKSLPNLERQLGCNLRQLEFSLDDIRDEHGTTVAWNITYGELQKVLHGIVNNPSYTHLFKSEACQSKYFYSFLKKNISNVFIENEYTPLWSTLFKIQVVSWYHSYKNSEKDLCIFIMEDRPWKEVLSTYAQNLNVSLKWQPAKITFKDILNKSQYLYPKIFDQLKKLKRTGSLTLKGSRLKKTIHLKISVESIGSFNLHEPEISSDIGYWHQSQLSSKNLLLYVTRPLTDKDWHECNYEAIDLIALSGKQREKMPFFFSMYKERFKLPYLSCKSSKESTLIKDQIDKYNYKKYYWWSYFEQTNTKIHVTHFKYDNSHIPKTDAIHELGGISVLWQLSYEELPSSFLTTVADVMFGFSQHHALIEQKHGSNISYHVATGYPGDYRFRLLKPKAEIIRKKLNGNGAKKIVTYLDENSSADERWSIGNSIACRDYEFLLEKILAVPWLGVIFKPKKPHTLRKRLNTIDELFDKAIATGRCHIFMAEASGIPPAIAALASDVAIHGSIWAATAGVEASLAGVPTLFMDHDNWHMSQFYQLGKEKVVFQSWQSLWDTLLEHWKLQQGIPGFGDWSPLLDDLDPFRDGKAAERMGTYLNWLIQGFEEGIDREVIMADTADRYCKQWGSDKVKTNIGL
jgi:hypothetical protein